MSVQSIVSDEDLTEFWRTDDSNEQSRRDYVNRAILLIACGHLVDPPVLVVMYGLDLVDVDGLTDKGMKYLYEAYEDNI